MSLSSLKILVLLFGATNLFALVDYSDPVSAPSSVSKSSSSTTRKSSPKARNSAKAARVETSSSSSFFDWFAPTGIIDLEMNYETIDVEDGQKSSKVNFYNFAVHMETPFNVYVDAKYSLANTKDIELSESSKSEPLNPYATIGLNWLQFGSPADMASVDLYGGLKYKGQQNQYTTSRTDRIFGVISKKRFQQFAIGLGYELRGTGSPTNIEELDIGNIQVMKASFAWNVSPDINFILDGESYRVNASSDGNRNNSLAERVNFGHLTPKLLLTLNHMAHLELGATFRTRKAKKIGSLLEASLWDLKGSYGNSIFVGLTANL